MGTILDMNELDRYLTTAQVASALGVTKRRVLALIAAKRLPAQIMGGGQRPIYLIARENLKLVKDRKPGRPKGTRP